MTSLLNHLTKTKLCCICVHTDPDIDAISSLLTLTSVLHSMGFLVTCRLENIPEGTEFLAGWDLFRELQTVTAQSPLDLIALDCGSVHRIWPKEVLGLANQIINIDHHFDNPLFGSVNIVDLTYSSTAEILYHLLKEGGIQLTTEHASNLYAGLLYDTGGFRYSNTKAATLVSAVEMINHGANPSLLANQVFTRMDHRSFKALELALKNAEYWETRGTLLSFVSYAEMKEHHLTNASFDGVIDILRQNRTVHYTILVREADPGIMKGSIRAKEPYVIGDLIKDLGGGGHKRAGGFTNTLSYERIKQILEEKLPLEQ